MKDTLEELKIKEIPKTESFLEASRNIESARKLFDLEKLLKELEGGFINKKSGFEIRTKILYLQIALEKSVEEFYSDYKK